MDGVPSRLAWIQPKRFSQSVDNFVEKHPVGHTERVSTRPPSRPGLQTRGNEVGSKMEPNALWNEVILRLQQYQSVPRVSTAFAYLARATARTDQHLIVEVPSNLVRDHLETHVRDSLHSAVRDVAGTDLTLIFAVNPELENMPMAARPEEESPTVGRYGVAEDKRAEVEESFASSWAHKSEGTLSADRVLPSSRSPQGRNLSEASPLADDPSRLNPKYTFDTFVTGSSNRFAQAAATAVAEAPARAYNPLFIYGGSGLGKTHLLHAIGHYAQHLFPQVRVKYVNSEEFTNDFINSIRDDKAENFQRRYRNVDVLLIDDIQFLGGKEQTVEEFFHTFNTLHNDSKQVVITSDTPPKQLEGFEERLISRFEWGLLTDVQPLFIIYQALTNGKTLI